MAYLIYKATPVAGGLRYHDRENVVLAGGGLIKSTCLKHLSKKDGGWILSEQDLLMTAGRTPADHRLVIDTAPSRKSLSLFEVKHIVGYTYEDWTPVLLLMEQLFVDHEPDGPKADFEKDFEDISCERCKVRTVLYLKGGHAGGDWNWGGNSRTTAALLWDSAWDFFLEKAKRLEQ